MQKPLWVEINRSEFEELKRDIYDNQDDKDFKINIWIIKCINIFEKKPHKISKREARKLYDELIQIDIDALERNKSNDVRKYNILMILNNVDAIFTGAYVHYKEMSKEAVFERSITERLKSRKERSAEIKRKEQNINNELLKKYFTDYQSSSNMYNKLINPENVRIIKILVDSIKKRLTRVKKSIEKVSENKTFKIGENEKIIDIIERILEFNNKIQLGQGLKILAPT